MNEPHCSIGELTNRLSADTQVIQSAVTENFSMLARYTMQMLISIGLMFYISAKLTAVLLSVIPVIVVSAVQYGMYACMSLHNTMCSTVRYHYTILCGCVTFWVNLRSIFEETAQGVSGRACTC